jgi:ComF family protein
MMKHNTASGLLPESSELKRIFTALAELIFPTGCMTCGTVLDYQAIPVFCADCFSQIKFIQSPLCPCCGIPFEATTGDDHLCGDCIANAPVFSLARSAGRYENVLLDAIHQFKYRGKTAVGKSLGRFMAEFSYPGFSIADYSLVIPVPLHIKRLRERGFNQSVILAREIARRFTLPLDFMALRRNIHTDPQVGRGKKEREENVRGVFEIRTEKAIGGEKILLVDDVYTTGSTLRECAGILKKHGAREVAALTLARAA